jgi:hypothetical protein
LLDRKRQRIDRQETAQMPAQDLFRKKPCRRGPQQESWSPQTLTDLGVDLGEQSGQDSRVGLRIARGN